MSESFPQPEQTSGPEPEAVAGEGPAKRKGRLARVGRVVPRGAGARWAVAGAAAAVIVGGGAAAVAVAGHHHGHHEPMAKDGRPGWSAPDHEGGHGGGHGPKGERPHPRDPKVRDGAAGARGESAKKRAGAPVPLPALPIDQAAQKAAATVPGGKVEALRAVPQQGGGSAWQAVVLGPDGVRHAVTLSGTDGTPTANTPLAQG
ncbi:hypothetical protein BX286_0725 [Streptomyces sp. 3211.6]|uniref:hypothetical protein n=1 Tax=Streptomyces TaxID=1883 RepID=UPI0009A495E8|nr:MULTISPECIES: hypothetical protein [Streptomyces]RKT02814.1 hypothetical protein BX286_0725 [Streptomyces sp. 3211.6]RPF44138.1 hypothetical protein EDD96_0658 [Streptomyces sp. Ag109_G2-6]